MIVLNKLVEHMNGEHVRSRRGNRLRIDEKCCRPFQVFVEAAEQAPEVAEFKPRARITKRGHKGSTS